MTLSRSACRARREDWQRGFLKMLPQLKRLLTNVFDYLDPENREEAKQDALVNCLVAYVRLHKRRRTHVASASNLVWYAVLHVKSGRTMAARQNVRDPLSRYAQLRRGISVKRLHQYDSRFGNWIDLLVKDQRAPIPDVVAARLDVSAWLATLCRRTRQIARDLAKGYSTAEAADKYGVSAGRISQIRRELERSWQAFQHEPARI
jgi:hypothetical protein